MALKNGEEEEEGFAIKVAKLVVVKSLASLALLNSALFETV